jgi:hypothetical protein
VFSANAYDVGNVSSYNNPGRGLSGSSRWGLVQSTRSQQRQIEGLACAVCGGSRSGWAGAGYVRGDAEWESWDVRLLSAVGEPVCGAGGDAGVHDWVSGGLWERARGDVGAPAEVIRSEVKRRSLAAAKLGRDATKPYFRGPRQFVKIAKDAEGPLYHYHNRNAGLAECPNGDPLAIWYTLCAGAGQAGSFESAAEAIRIER